MNVRSERLLTACVAGLVALSVLRATTTQAADCNQTSVNVTPINDLGTGLYLGQFQGGLYPSGSNAPPALHTAVGEAWAQGIQPLDQDGLPSVDGKYVLLSIGMSNTTQEFCSHSGNPPCNAWTFMGRAAVHPQVNHDTLVIANGAMGGQAAASWDSPADPNYDRVRDTVLMPMGLTEAQVQIVWVKEANPSPTVPLPNPKADAYALLTQLGDIARAVKVRYPNVRIVFLSSRIYAGYATTSLNPEPYAYESGFAIKWLIEAQIDQMDGGQIDPRVGDLNYATVAPWLAWGPYLWADGLNPRSDGLVWRCIDLADDGTHPSTFGQGRVGLMLLDFMLAAPFATPWFRADGGTGSPADLNGDGCVDSADLTLLLGAWAAGTAAGDIDGDGDTDSADLTLLLGAWAAGGCP